MSESIGKVHYDSNDDCIQQDKVTNRGQQVQTQDELKPKQEWNHQRGKGTNTNSTKSTQKLKHKEMLK